MNRPLSPVAAHSYKHVVCTLLLPHTLSLMHLLHTHTRARACTRAVSHTLVLRSPRSQTTYRRSSSELISYTEPHPPFLLIQRGSCCTVWNTSGCIFKGLLLSVSSFINTSSLLLTHFVERRCRPWKINSQICYKLVPYLFPDGHFTSYHYSNCWTHV